MTDGNLQARGRSLALVVGGDSLVGAAIHSQCRQLAIPVAVSSRRKSANALFLDLGDPDFGPLERTACDVAFVCAAVTDMRACQNDPVGTRRINVDNTIELMRRLADKGTHLLFLSTSQVFDGKVAVPAEDAATNPRNEYGAQKLAVEQAIQRYGLPAAVLRPTKIFGDRPVGIFKLWLEALAENTAIRAATNMALSPVMVDDVARIARWLAAERQGGIWHLGAADELTYFEAAKLMAERQHKPVSLVIGEELTEAQVPSIFRLGNASLSSEKIVRALEMPLRRARDVLGGLFGRSPPTAAAPREA
jgi:dTDP-4-dehydrorhamnose reductase